MSFPTEQVQGQDTVYRLVDYPRMYTESDGLLWDAIFEFCSGQPESLLWGKYVTTHVDVHNMGCERESTKRSVKPGFRYAGFVSGIASNIRSIRTPTGQGFEITHYPAEGIHHLHINYLPNPITKKLHKAEKSDLRQSLRNCFSQIVTHDCVR